MVVRLIDWFALSEKLHLVKTLDMCEVWLIKNFGRFQGEYSKLFVLGQDNVNKIMRGLSEKWT